MILWRRKEAAAGALAGTLSSWVVLEACGYSLLSLLSNALLLLIVVLFLWAKAARLLNRPPPPVPDIRLPEAAVSRLKSVLDALLSAFKSIALAEDAALFYGSASLLCCFSLLGSLATFTTSFYICKSFPCPDYIHSSP